VILEFYFRRIFPLQVDKLAIIKTDEQYKGALALVEELMDSNLEPGTGDADKLELLILLISNYEKEYFPMEWQTYQE
jgi:antitoxin component HigA of HigAB toxin-antitoxin module